MQPPPQRKQTDAAMRTGPRDQQRPHFATASGPVTRRTYHAPHDTHENKQSPMQRSCQRPYNDKVEPLLAINRYKEEYAPRAAPGAGQGGPIRPKLIPKARPSLTYAQSTWD